MRRLNVDEVTTPIASQWKGRDHAYYEHLKRRLMWQMILAHVTPLVLLSILFHYQYGVTVKEGVDNHITSIAENQRNTVDLFLQERVSNLRSEFGLLELESPADPAAMDTVLRDLTSESDTFVDVGLFSADGTLVSYAGPHPQLIGKNYAGEDWWQDLLGNDSDHHISDVYLGFRGRPHFIVALERRVGEERWVVRASVDPETFGEFVGESHLVEDGEAFIVNARGDLQTMKKGVRSDGFLTDVPGRSPETVVRKLRDGKARHLAAFAWLNENDWILVVRVPESQAYAPVMRARIVLVAIMLVTGLIVVLLVLRSTRRLVGKLEQMDEARQRLRGHLFNAAKLASVGEMAAGVAHEINNPLAIIYEEAGMLTDLHDPDLEGEASREELLERLGAISDAAIRGRSITRKLMAFARQHDPVLEPTRIDTLVSKVLGVKARELEIENIEVVLDLEPDLPDVPVNPNQMEQVLFNLINNARDAIDGEGQIGVSTRLVDGEMHLEVRDDGCGMDQEQMERAFFPFYTTKDVGRGTGLGLSISYGIVKSFGGRIEVASEPGEGTKVTIILPTGDRAAADPRKRLDARRHDD